MMEQLYCSRDVAESWNAIALCKIGTRISVALVSILWCVSTMAGNLVQMDPKDDIRQVLSDDVLAGWVVTASFDVDQDGDMDKLVAHEHASSGGNLSWTVFFRESDDYFISETSSGLSGHIYKFEFAPVKVFDGKRAFITYSKSNAVSGTVRASRFEKVGPKKVVRHDRKLRDINLSDKEGESSGDWEFLEKTFGKDSVPSQVLNDYRRYSEEEAKAKFLQ